MGRRWNRMRRRVLGCTVAALIALPVLFSSAASAQVYYLPIYNFKDARGDASIDYGDVAMFGNGTAGGHIRLVVDGPGSYYVKYRAAERGPLPWHRGTNNVKRSHGVREFVWTDNFALRTWAYEFKICKAIKYRKDPCGRSMAFHFA